MCPNMPGKKKSPHRGRPSGRPADSQNLTASPPQAIQPDTTGTGSHHKYLKLNQWKVKNIKAALEEKSKAAIAKKYGLSPSTFGNRTFGRVQGYEH